MPRKDSGREGCAPRAIGQTGPWDRSDSCIPFLYRGVALEVRKDLEDDGLGNVRDGHPVKGEMQEEALAQQGVLRPRIPNPPAAARRERFADRRRFRFPRSRGHS